MPLPETYDPALDRDLEEKYRVELEDRTCRPAPPSRPRPPPRSQRMDGAARALGCGWDDGMLIAGARVHARWAAGFDNVIVVDNVPRVSQEKEEKLKNVLRKTFKPCGEIRENGIHLPRGDDPANPGATLTRGYVYDTNRGQSIKGRVGAGVYRGPSRGWSGHGPG